MGARLTTSIDIADTAEAIVQRVEAFDWRDHRDAENWDIKSHMGIDPMLLGFSMELVLKAWYAFDYDDLTTGHNLTELFGKLKPASQEMLDAEFRRSVAPHHPSFLHVDYSIDTVLRKHEDAFREWRYLYEPRKKKIALSFEQSVFVATLKMMIAEFRKRYETIPYSIPNRSR